MTSLVLLTAIVIKSSLLLLAAFGATFLLRRQSAALRHVVWVLAFVGAISLPLTLRVAPRVDVPVAFWEVSTYRSVHPRSSVAPTSSPTHVGALSSSSPDAPEPAPIESLADHLLSSFTLYLLAVWAIGFLWIVGRALIGLYSLRCLRAFGTKEFSHERLAVDASRLAQDIGLQRPWELRQAQGEEPASALTWGVAKPVVLVPSNIEAWSPQRQRAVLLHELAHVRRLDFLSQLLAEVGCALFWFNPLSWLGARALRAEAESAADDAVLRSGIRPSTYAEELLRIAAEIGHRRPLVTQPGIPVMNPIKIESRLQSVLSPVTRRGLTAMHTLSAFALAVVAVPAIAGLQVVAPQTAVSKRSERTEALSRIKQIAVATLMYSNDFDDMYPYVQQTASAAAVLHPYLLDQECFQSPTKNGKFLYNLNVGGVVSTTIEDLATIPMWSETLPDSADRPAYAFMDSHAKLLSGAALEEAKASARKHFARPKSSKPLPRDYMITDTIRP